MKLLIAGLGSIGRRHCSNFIKLGVNDFVFYRSHQSSFSNEEYDKYPSETNLKQALDHNPDAVIISNPTSLHLDVAIEAAQRGLPILLEKPISNHLDGVQELIHISKKSGSEIVVGFQFRYHPLFIQSKKILEANGLGEITSFRVHYDENLKDIHPWEDYRKSYAARPDLGGGCIHTFCHPLDYSLWFLGRVQKLWAFCGHSPSLNILAESTSEISLRFESGALGHIHLGFNRSPPSHEFEIIGSEGSLTWSAHNNTLHHYDSKNQSNQKYFAPKGFERNSMFLDEAKHFMRVVQGNEQPICSLDDGIAALKLGLAAHLCEHDETLKIL